MVVSEGWTQACVDFHLINGRLEFRIKVYLKRRCYDHYMIFDWILITCAIDIEL